MSTSDQVVHDLEHILEKDRDLAAVLEKSLQQAHARAREDLDPVLFDALEWPQDIPGYLDYLSRFIRWIPQQSDAAAWRRTAPEERYAKEVSDRLAHFFWLIDQKVDVQGTAVTENSEVLRDWLTEFARRWGSFLDTPESFDQEILDAFLRDAPEYTIEESLVDGRPNMPSGWLTFNQFFARELNSGLRPVRDPHDNRVVTSPADCIFQHSYAIDAESNIPDTTIKGSHHYGNIAQLIEGSRHADAFANGTFVHYMLPPSAYHRFHLPVAGVVDESFVVSGKVFMQVDLVDHELQSRDSAETGYEFSQTRGVVTLDTSSTGEGNLGTVAVIPVGMSHVASVTLTSTPGTRVAKGEEFGYFQFGGSDIIVLFQEGVDPDISTSRDLRQVGSPIAHCRLLP